MKCAQVKKLITAILAVGLLSACQLLPKGGNRIFVPELSSARDQFVLAQQKEKDLIMADKASDRYHQQMREVVEAYEMVLRNFPEDLVLTPWAKVRLSQLYKDQGHEKKALRMVESVMKDYGDQPAVDAKARYMKGRILESMGKNLQAQETYKACRDRYKTSENSDAKKIAGDCDRLYSRVLTLDK